MSATRIFIVRHGERCDSIGKNFLENNFDENGSYKPTNLNMPATLPKRSDGYQAFSKDIPLTEVGAFSASLLGRAYKQQGINVDKVYSSPSLRCVQTSQGFLKGYGEDHPIIIEPGLFEFMGFFVYQGGHPSWMTEDDFRNMGVSISTNYDKIYTEDQIIPEVVREYYERSMVVVKKLFERHPGENILCFAHSTSHDACSRLITGGSHRTAEQFNHILAHSQFVCNIESDGKIVTNGNPVMPLTICAVKPYFHELHTLSDEELNADMETKSFSRFVKNL